MELDENSVAAGLATLPLDGLAGGSGGGVAWIYRLWSGRRVGVGNGGVRRLRLSLSESTDRVAASCAGLNVERDKFDRRVWAQNLRNFRI